MNSKIRAIWPSGSVTRSSYLTGRQRSVKCSSAATIDVV
jgi:hypothetical protein